MQFWDFTAEKLRKFSTFSTFNATPVCVSGFVGGRSVCAESDVLGSTGGGTCRILTNKFSSLAFTVITGTRGQDSPASFLTHPSFLLQNWDTVWLKIYEKLPLYQAQPYFWSHFGQKRCVLYLIAVVLFWWWTIRHLPLPDESSNLVWICLQNEQI